jgi:putative ABC transport system substrate-binding protein
MRFDQTNRRAFIMLIGGVAVAWPQVATAQTGMRRIGVLMAFQENDARANGWLARFISGLAELGWNNGRNLRIEVRWAADSVDQMRAFAKELVNQQPDLILSFGTPATAALQRETRTIPIVFAIVSDPVGEGFVAALAHPGGNITGFHNSEDAIGGKWLELLSQIAPTVRRAAMIFNPETSPRHGNYYMPDFETAAKSLNIEPIAAPVHNLAELEQAIADLGREPASATLTSRIWRRSTTRWRARPSSSADCGHCCAWPCARTICSSGRSRPRVRKCGRSPRKRSRFWRASPRKQ